MVYYITSPVYQQVITNALGDYGDIISGCQVNDEIDLLKFVHSEGIKLIGTDRLIIDLQAVNNTEAEIIQAIKEYRCLDTDNMTRIIILASGRQPGDPLLRNLFQSGILNIIHSDDFLIILNELKICLSTAGKSYKDALIYDEILQNITVTRREIKRVINKVVVGICGAQHRIGTTHCGIVTANWLRKKGYMVAYVETNSSRAFTEIAEGYSEKYFGDRYKYFTMYGVDYYPATNENTETITALADVVAKNYNFIIADYGVFDEADLVAFNKSDIKLIVAGTKPWETGSLNTVFSMTSGDAVGQYNFLFNFCQKSQETRKDIKTSMPGQAVYFLETTDDPFESSKIMSEADAVSIFRDWMPQDADEKKGLFGRIKKKNA